MIEKFAGVFGMGVSEFIDLNHTSYSMDLVSLVIPKFARDAGGEGGELRTRDTSCMTPVSRIHAMTDASMDRRVL
jgi:hypothetical protein